MSTRTALRHTRTAVRVVLYSVLGSGVCLGSAFIATHIWIEMHDPTPGSWPHAARFSYRAALFNKDYLSQPASAKRELSALLRTLKQQPRASEAPTDGDALIADSMLSKVHTVLGDIAQDEGEFHHAQECYSSAIVSCSKLIEKCAITCKLARSQEAMGDDLAAINSYENSIQYILPHYTHNRPLHDFLAREKDVPEVLLDSIAALALVLARNAEYEAALELLLTHLEALELQPALSDRCKIPLTMAHLAQVLWGLGDKSEATRWTEKSLLLCSDKAGSSRTSCVQCAGMNYDVLGLLAMRSSAPLKDNARVLFRKAMTCAEQSHDVAGQKQYAEHLREASV